MKKEFQDITLVLILFSAGFSSCVNLKSVSSFSSASLTAVNKFKDINYTFRQHCVERCTFEAIQKFEIKRELECNCDSYKKADQVTRLIYNAIKSYFTGLAGLSNNNLTDYNLKALQKSLAEGSFGDVIIEEEQVAAFSKMSNVLLKASTDIYRKNKIRKYVQEANAPLQVLLKKFRFILQENLVGELTFKKEKLFAWYQEIKMNNSLSDYEKRKTVTNYYEQLSAINGQEAQITAFSKGLQHIAAGHQKLFDNRNKMTGKELRDLLTGYASDIQSISSEFNQLQN